MAARRSRPTRESFRHAGEEWRRGNVGRSLFGAFQAFEHDLLCELARQGFVDIRRLHLNLYRNLDFDGNRLTILAQRASMTKQGMQELVDRSEAAGYVERRADPADRRAKIVAFSSRGLQLLDALHQGILFAERRMAAVIGASAVEHIAELLNRYRRESVDADDSEEMAS